MQTAGTVCRQGKIGIIVESRFKNGRSSEPGNGYRLAVKLFQGPPLTGVALAFEAPGGCIGLGDGGPTAGRLQSPGSEVQRIPAQAQPPTRQDHGQHQAGNQQDPAAGGQGAPQGPAAHGRPLMTDRRRRAAAAD